MLSITRHQGNSNHQPTKQQAFLDHSTNLGSNTTHPADVQPNHTNSDLDFRVDQDRHDSKNPSQMIHPTPYGFDYLPNTSSSHHSSSSSNSHHGPSPVPVEPLPAHSYPSDPSSTFIPLTTPSLATSLNFPHYSSLAGSARDHLDWAADSLPLTSDKTCDPAPLSLVHPSEQPIQSSRSLLISASQHHRKDPRFIEPYVSSLDPPPLAKKSDEGNLPVKLGPNGLAEDQPPTAQGKLRTRVYVACLQCRSRKIRCDGAKPQCQKCCRRASECDYDAVPKRRGPDKKPGARQRTSKKTKASKQEAQNGSQVAAAVPSDERNIIPLYSSSIKPCHEDSSLTSQHLNPASHIFTPLPHPNFPELNERRGSMSSSTEQPLPITPIDGPEITSSLPPVSNATTASNIPYRPERVDASNRFSRLLPESVADEVNLLITLKENYEIIRGLNSQGEAHKFPYYGHNQTLFGDYPARGHSGEDENKWEEEIGPEPSLDYSRKAWWDSLIVLYLPGEDKAITSRQILADLRFFNFCNPSERDKMQPSLVLAILAVSAFMTSSEIDQGSAGRMRALWLRDAAQSSLEASFNAQWVDPTLAQAAWLLALFEMCAHPLHSAERVNSAMVILDSILRFLRLASIDEDDLQVSKFVAQNVPIVHVAVSSRIASKQGCCCASLTLGQNSPISHQLTPLWVATAAWNPDWTVAEIRKEESRRLCWSSLQIAAGHTAHAAAFRAPPLDYYCIQPSNYSLLFPGESLLKSSSFTISHSPKESIWALYCRTMLLWNSCLRMRENQASDAEKATFAVSAWIETTIIEEALNAHTCGCDQAFLFQGREFLFITRMCISYEFRRFIPHPETDFNGLFNRKKAEEWLVKQASIAKRVMQGLHTVTGHKNNVLAQRPFFIWWFMGQVARCLLLWQLDKSLIIALEICEAFFAPIDYLSCLWPCPTQRARYLELQSRVSQACELVGLPPPPPPNFDLFAPGSPPVPVV
ncbi:hypothetical protein Clacol_007538 [Clathrus columnatus]|uniref:Zn(2)-C6 fungal-type domain-containing protein n=1 Tax=Clathrus columnatus TaxID=1419009 RepID=A0AAV5AK12_9AGAM|nr:hypothetical protein Clacol_007538 [Clathrus columnatus]